MMSGNLHVSKVPSPAVIPKDEVKSTQRYRLLGAFYFEE